MSRVEEEIRRHAYEIYEERGREQGHDLDDWVRAEAEVSGVARVSCPECISINVQ